MTFEPTRATAIKRLADFTPHMGRDYASMRNYDRDGHTGVSRLSPYLRHRIITEDDVLRAALARHSASSAEKFIQEVYWRTYWKGWLEQRPSIWTNYRAGVNAALNRVQTESGLRSDWEAACFGQTAIDCFDHWAQELVQTGYLHNHARMWFASIWIFTLRLPWELGADFFLRHLLDGDAASNTLGWRWVAGLQTVGKTYLARPDNIAKYTDGRFNPHGLASFAAPLEGPPHPERSPLPVSDRVPKGRIGLLLTEDDLSPDWLLDTMDVDGIAVFDGTTLRSPLHVGPHVIDFASKAIDDLETRIGTIHRLASPEDVETWTQGFDGAIMPYAPVGATADALSGMSGINRQIRAYDAAAWPHAKAGFFKFKANIPKLLSAYDDQLTLL